MGIRFWSNAAVTVWTLSSTLVVLYECRSADGSRPDFLVAVLIHVADRCFGGRAHGVGDIDAGIPGMIEITAFFGRRVELVVVALQARSWRNREVAQDIDREGEAGFVAIAVVEIELTVSGRVL